MCLKIFKRKENDMQYTDNLNLNLPEAGDYIEDTSREAWNDNFEVLDAHQPARYVVATYDLTPSRADRTHSAKIYFYSDNTYEAIMICQLINPNNIASGTVMASYGAIYPWSTTGTYSLPSECSYTISNVLETYSSCSPMTVSASPSVPQVYNVGVRHPSGNTVYSRLVEVKYNSSLLRFEPYMHGAYALVNTDEINSTTLNETDQSKFPRVIYIAKGTYTT